jgi:tetratricopeptide (TPR) repeat protein
MRKIVFIFLLLVIFIPGRAQKINELIEKGTELLGREKYDSALLVFNRAWKLDSTNYYVNLNRGRVYFALKDWQGAFEDFSTAIILYPDSIMPYHERGILLLTTMNTDDAIADNTKALQLAKDDSMLVFSYMNRGTCYQQKREFQLAYEDYSRAYILDTTSVSVMNNIATVLDELGRRDESILILKKLVRIDSTIIGPYVNLGFQYSKLGKYKEAIEFFNKALELEKDEPLALNNRGYAKYSLQDYKGALEDINKSLEGYPGNSYALRNRALVYIALKEKDKACTDISAGLTLGFTKMYGNELLELRKTHCR